MNLDTLSFPIVQISLDVTSLDQSTRGRKNPLRLCTERLSLYPMKVTSKWSTRS